MAKFNELSILDLLSIVNLIDIIFNMYNIDKASKDAFWEYIDIGNKKYDGA